MGHLHVHKHGVPRFPCHADGPVSWAVKTYQIVVKIWRELRHDDVKSFRRCLTAAVFNIL
jgi:hypothetical protein